MLPVTPRGSELSHPNTTTSNQNNHLPPTPPTPAPPTIPSPFPSLDHPNTTPGHKPASRFRILALAATLALGSLPACKAVGPAFGTSPADASRNATEFFEAFAVRYTNPERDAAFNHARERMARHALNPSSIFNDSTVWNGRTEASRSLMVQGQSLQNRYRFSTTTQPVALTKPGNSRHVMSLTRVDDGIYRWDTGVDMAFGRVSPHELHAVWKALLTTAEKGTNASLRSDYRAAFPRTTQALGRMLSLDSLNVRTMADGSSFVMLVATMHPDSVQKAGFPEFGRYLEKYFGNARYTISLTNGAGRRWLDATLYRKHFLFQFRVKNGQLLALDGTPSAFPRQTTIEIDASAKFGLFTVGVEKLRGQLTLIESPVERGWLFQFQKEPDWDFPLAVDRLIRTSLRRPFANAGSSFRMTAIQGPTEDSQTIIARHLTTTVEESTIVRWLGNLGFTAMNDFQEVEDEEARFVAEVFRAMAVDVGQ